MIFQKNYWLVTTITTTFLMFDESADMSIYSKVKSYFFDFLIEGKLKIDFLLENLLVLVLKLTIACVR
jgi:hypothetical protein